MMIRTVRYLYAKNTDKIAFLNHERLFFITLKSKQPYKKGHVQNITTCSPKGT